MPLVSVIMPYYKKINFVINAINSVLNQSFQNFELILIYDDTNLSDLEIIKNKFKNNTKLKIIKNNENFGAGISRNIGISKSIGDIIAFIDSDDYWFQKKLEKQIIIYQDDKTIKFAIDAFRKKCLIEGLDDIGLTLQKNNKIDVHEEKIHNLQPWII